MPTIQLVGEEYHGHDGAKAITLHPGDSVEVSEAKAEQLRRDFPDRFAFEDSKPRPAKPRQRRVEPAE